MALSLRNEAPVFLLALQFLTRLPITVRDYSPERMAASPRWYPGVGVVVGLAEGLVFLLADWIWGAWVGAVLAVAAAVLLTGAMHEDGFADACDGLGGGRTKDRALEIMRDSRIGAYGAVGLMLMLGGRVALLAGLDPLAAPFVLMAGHAISRAAMLWVMQVDPYVRGQGTGSPVAQPIDEDGRQLAIGTVLVAALPLLIALPLYGVILAGAGAGLGLMLMRQRFRPMLGGYTGDCLGAVQQSALIGFLLGAAAF